MFLTYLFFNIIKNYRVFRLIQNIDFKFACQAQPFLESTLLQHSESHSYMVPDDELTRDSPCWVLLSQ